MPQPDVATIADLVRVHAAKRPDAIALVVGERIISFAELDARSSQAAQAFRAAPAQSHEAVTPSVSDIPFEPYHRLTRH